MTSEKDIIQKYDSLYKKMASSQNVEDMHLFGGVLRDAMEWLARNKSDKAEEYIERLCAINWDNYLTRSEAEKIIQGMEPSAPWSYEAFCRAASASGVECEESPYYNSYAMWVAVSMKYSDSAHTIARILGFDKLSDVEEDQMFTSCIMLARDILKDKDGVFNIRQYFNL